MSRCLICRKPLTPKQTGRHRLYCGDKCRQQANRLIHKVVQPSVTSSTDGAMAGGGDVLASTAATGPKE